MKRVAILTLMVMSCAVGGTSMPIAHIENVAHQPVQVSVQDFSPVPAEAVGMLLREDGACSMVAVEPTIALTAAHCVLLEDHVTPYAGVYVGYAFGKHGEVTLVDNFDVVWYDMDTDIAIVHAKTGRFYDMAKIHQELPVPEDPTWVVGYGCDSDWPHLKAVRSYRPGYFVEVDEAMGGYIFYGHACHGDSGGGIFSANGELIAITSGASEHYIVAPLASMALPGLLLD